MDKFNKCDKVLKETKFPRTLFTCTGCKYKSNRQYNVTRHTERIHIKLKLHVCCGQKFFNKGDYYIHCEQLHPETRAHAATSRKKYKITADTMSLYDENLHQSNCFKQKQFSYNLRSRQSFSKIIRTRKHKKVKSNVSVEYSITYTSLDIENIPLINFFTDHQLKSYLRRFSSSKLVNKTGDKSAKEANQTVKIAISTEESVEKAVSENGVENVRSKVSNSDVSSFSVELPAKKLILKRFRTNVMHEIQMPLQDQNNNIRSQVHFVETQSKETVSVIQNWSKSSNRSMRINKENKQMFTVSVKKNEELRINLDTAITAPMETQLQRDYLAPIDFEKYKIF